MFQNCFKNGIIKSNKENERTEEIKMSKLRKLTRDDFNDTMNRLYVMAAHFQDMILAITTLES